jgi:hypothetical protein
MDNTIYEGNEQADGPPEEDQIITPVTYFIWHPNMVALGAISSKLSLTPRDNPVRCVRGDMLSDFDS